MAFEWSSIEIGDIIRKSHIVELRQNIDSIKDNLACITHKSGVHSAYDLNVDSDDYSSVDNGHDSTINTIQRDAYKDSDYDPYNSTAEATYYAGEDLSYDNGENTYVDDSYNSDVR